MQPTTAVVLDSDQNRRDDIRTRLTRCGIVPICFQDAWICLENIHHIRPAFAVFRPDSRETAVRFVNIAKAIRRTFPVIVLSNQREIERFVDYSWLADLIFLRYPADDREFQRAIALLSEWKPNVDRPVIIAGSLESQKRIGCLPRLGRSTEPVLIQGEPGVGKRMMARAIHSFAMAENADLFFTNAKDISGRWIREIHKRVESPYAVDQKALFTVIENIENLSMDRQAQLLLIMEMPSDNQRINGSRQSFRLIVLTETDLERFCREGHFRKDLYHRLSVLKMTLPPLRDRRDDVPVLAEFFASQYGIQNGGSIYRLPEAVRTVLKQYDWPGNVSELKGAIEQSLAASGSNLTENLSTWCSNHLETLMRPSSESTIDVNADLRRFLKNNRDMPLKKAKQGFVRQVESQIMRVALSSTNGNCKKAAGLLNISYKSMLNKAKAYNLQ